ncbi:MAG: radical SAM protein, partial [Actinomycetota bacterium]|nr:radical SAM protein [Actinomycetota bacterium]
ATHVYPILLHLRPKVREVYMDWLQAEYPHLVAGYEKMYVGSYAARSEQKALSDTVQEIIRAAPQKERATPIRTGARHREAARARAEKARLEAEQLSLI